MTTLAPRTSTAPAPRTAPRHAGARSSALNDMAMRLRYALRLALSTREHAAYAATVSLRGAL